MKTGAVSKPMFALLPVTTEVISIELGRMLAGCSEYENAMPIETTDQTASDEAV
jgi:hypothetical protein